MKRCLRHLAVSLPLLHSASARDATVPARFGIDTFEKVSVEMR